MATQISQKNPQKSAAKSTKSTKPGNGNGHKKLSEVKREPKYIAQQANRKRFTFGPVWTNAVLEGKVKDKIKLVAHGVFLEAGEAHELAPLDMEKLLEKVQKAIIAQQKKQH